MLPALLLVGVGRHRRIWIPLPVFVFWPLWLAGWVIWFLLWFFRIPWQRLLRIALFAGAYLSGTSVDVETANGENVHVRLI